MGDSERNHFGPSGFEQRAQPLMGKSERNQFIVVRLEYEKEENPCNVLNRSAGFCKTTVSWDVVLASNFKLSSGTTIGDVTGESTYRQIFFRSTFFILTGPS